MIRKLVLILLACACFFSCRTTGEGENLIPGVDIPEDTVNFNGKEYKSVFFDDFNGTRLNTKNWEKCPEWERQNHDGNGCWWKNSCSYVKDGNLVLEAKREGGKNFSGGIRSNRLFEQKNGLYSFRFKAERASGLWYAIWLMSHTEGKVGNGAVDGGEIDIVELVPTKKDKLLINSAVHWDGYGPDHKSHGSEFYQDNSFYDKWHVLTFEWTPEYYKAYLDNSETPFWDSEIEGASAWGGIVETANYIKITCEFGSWGGPVNESELPSHFYVDWVKVYKQN